MGSLDSVGIWKYDNTDHVTPLAAFMNLLANSVSLAIGALRTDLTPADTGWVTLTLLAPWVGTAGELPQARKIDDVVYLRGTATRSAVTGNVDIANLADRFKPGSMVEGIGYAGSGAFYRGTISTSGAVAANNFSGTTFRFSVLSPYAI